MIVLLVVPSWWYTLSLHRCVTARSSVFSCLPYGKVHDLMFLCRQTFPLASCMYSSEFLKLIPLRQIASSRNTVEQQSTRPSLCLLFLFLSHFPSPPHTPLLPFGKNNLKYTDRQMLLWGINSAVILVIVHWYWHHPVNLTLN